MDLCKTAVVYGPTGVAKSSFAINHSLDNHSECAVIFLTSEMSPKDIMERATIISNGITSEVYKSASATDKVGFNNINATKTNHITVLNNREANVTLDYLTDEVQRAKTTGVERVLLVIDSFNIWADSLKDSEDNIINRLITLQDETDINYLIICQEHRISNSVKHFADQVIKFTYERGGKSINGKKIVKMSTEKNRYADPVTKLVEFSGSEQKFYF